MTQSHIYYLHTNGDLIHKPNTDTQAADIRESDFAVALWFLDTINRADAWKLLVEATAAGGNKDRIFGLATKWGCTNEDAHNYANYLGLTLDMDGNAFCVKPLWFINLAVSPAGFGPTAIEAFADLANQLDYKPSKMWGNNFHDLVQENSPDSKQHGAGA